MAEDGESSTNKSLYQLSQETFQRAQETQCERKYPDRYSGIVQVQPGSKGPRNIYIKRNGDSFGFTLRHFILYPPESIAGSDRHKAVGALQQPMDTIFVRHVSEGSPAAAAGLQHGDRILAVNAVPVADKSYQEVVQLIQRSLYLQLWVVPKEEDSLQKLFPEAAHNPASNQISERSRRHLPSTVINNQSARSKRADTISYRSLQNPSHHDYGRLSTRSNLRQEQRSADDLLYSAPHDSLISSDRHKQFPNNAIDIYSEPVIDDASTTARRPRAQPQVPVYRKMGRRASEGNALSSDRHHIDDDKFVLNADVASDLQRAETMVVGNTKDTSKTADSAGHLNHHHHRVSSGGNSGLEMASLGSVYPSTAIGYRLSLDGRRQSSASLLSASSSSVADGSKDNLSSFDSSSTLTGQDTDEQSYITKLRKSVQRKEEFLSNHNSNGNSSSGNAENAALMIQKAYYGRAGKLNNPVWPPNEQTARTESPPPASSSSSARATKPTHHNFQRVKNDIETERDYVCNAQQNDGSGAKMPEAAVAPSGLDHDGAVTMNGAADCYGTSVQMVHKRAKQFESGKPSIEDDPLANDRTSFYRSELSRISEKKVVPNVPDRAREFEMISELQRDNSATSATTTTSSTNASQMRRNLRDTRSLESTDNDDVLVHRTSRIRERSNSAESWIALHHQQQQQQQQTKAKTQHVTSKLADAVNKQQESMMDVTYENREVAVIEDNENEDAFSPIGCVLIPESVERINNSSTDLLMVPDVATGKVPAVRPTILHLEAPKRPARHLRPPCARTDEDGDISIRPNVSPVNDKPAVVRRNKTTNLGDEERAMRRESYLKAREGGEIDLSDGDISPQVLRSGSLSGGSSSSVSLEKEKTPNATATPSSSSSAASDNNHNKLNATGVIIGGNNVIIKEGTLQCKITDIDGKRFAARSWRQVRAVLRGPKLFLYKDGQHQSPVGTSDPIEPSLSSGVDMTSSQVRVPEDYTKKKHVLRVSSLYPCRSELLLQAESPNELADWVKALQEQAATATEAETKLDRYNNSKQQAVPQSKPALTSIHEQQHPSISRRLSSPQPTKAKLPDLRNRSPTGQSPVSKTRKPTSQVNADGSSSGANPTSPKSKTWRGRVVKQFRKIHQGGASSPSSPTAPEGSTFGVPLEHCLRSNYNEYVPRIVEICTDIVEGRGLDTVGIYRVPGNSAAVTALTEEVNKCHEEVAQTDQRWNDVHVVSSLLKSFFRKMPDSLLTTNLYPEFIEADKIKDPNARMETIKGLVRRLPPHHYHTLKHLVFHLQRILENCETNRMPLKNLAIVFGPTIVRAGEESMVRMVNDMNHQCKIVESLLDYADWFFNEDDTSSLQLPVPSIDEYVNESDIAINQALLRDNINKIEGNHHKDKLFHNLISAAQRKVKRKTTGKNGTLSQDSKDEPISPTTTKEFAEQLSPCELKEENVEASSPSNLSKNEAEKSIFKGADDGIFKYSRQDEIQKRVANFIVETEANLQRPRRPEIMNNNFEFRHGNGISSSAGNVNQSARLSYASGGVADSRTITKTHSASNVFSRTSSTVESANPTRNSLNTDEYGKVQYPNNNRNNNDFSAKNNNNKKQQIKYRLIGGNRNAIVACDQADSSGSSYNSNKSSFNDLNPNYCDRFSARRGSSAENVHASGVADCNSNGNLKKLKYEAENDAMGRSGSLDSLNKLQTNLDDGGDLLATMTKIFDEKKKTLNSSALTEEELPFADESPEKSIIEQTSSSSTYNRNKLAATDSPKLYRDPSLHKSHYNNNNNNNGPTKQQQEFTAKTEKDKKKETKENEKDIDSTQDENVPDNERHIVAPNQEKLTVNGATNNKINILTVSLSPSNNNNNNSNAKLKRSESLNKERAVANAAQPKRSDSTKSNDNNNKLKRSDSLTKTEKTECNINRRRELMTITNNLSSSRRAANKDPTKLKRKNGMPERSIKRRHTVGGTKDPDKINLIDNRINHNRRHHNNNNDDDGRNVEKQRVERNLRTSSPDLSGTRREKFVFEVNVFAPDEMVLSIRQNILGSRPQSFPDYKVPLESHV